MSVIATVQVDFGLATTGRYSAMLSEKLAGVGTALVTPFDVDNKIDTTALRTLVRMQIDAGIRYIVTCGTTGESPTVTHDEQQRVLEVVLQAADGHIDVVAGVGSNATAEAVSLAERAKAAGALAGLSVVPYYNCPTQEGLYQHFSAQEAVGLPLILYNIPGRTSVSLEVETIARLVELDGIVGIKEAAGYPRFIQDIQRCGKRLQYISGDDPLTLDMMDSGACGVISVVSNLFPREVVAMVEEHRAGNTERARRIEHLLAPVMEAFFVEKNPGPIKYAMAMRKLIHLSLRLPMVAPSRVSREVIANAVAEVEVALQDA